MKNNKIILPVVLAGSLLLSTSFPAYAEGQGNAVEQTAQEHTQKNETTDTDFASYTKNENVYASLAADGTASDAYVVNHFSVERPGKIVDYGKYDDIKNLTTLGSLTKENNSVDFQAEEGEFYYQGQMKNVELPWKFAINYKLDGKSVTADELAEKSGKLEITFKSTRNDKAEESFYDHYLMQVSLTLDSEKVRNIVADGATAADAGANRQLSFTVLPGSDAEFVIKADVNDFTMSGFSIAAVPYSMDIDMDQFNMDDFTEQISELTDAVDKLNDGASSLSDGINKLCDGNGNLLNGSSQIQGGLNELSSSSAAIVDASVQIQGSLEAISGQLAAIDFSGIPGLAEQMGALKNGLSALASKYGEFNNGLVSYTGGVDALAKNYGTFQSGVSSYLDGTVKIKDGAADLADGMRQFADGISDMPTQIQDTIDEMVGSFSENDYQAVSFTDGKNEDITSVQFVISTKGIEKPKAEKVTETEKKEGFWDRLKALFVK